MQQEMNCIGQQMKSGNNLDWGDVCYTYQTSQDNVQSPMQEHQQEVKKELDAYDPSRPIAAAASNQPEAQGSSVAVNPTPTPYPTIAQHVSMSQEVNNFIHQKVHQVEIGTEISHIVYKEPIFNLKNRGEMYGVYGVYTYRPKKEDIFSNQIINMYRVDSKISFGQMDYTSDSGIINGIQDYLFELRGVMGYDYFIAPDWRITPYIGFGYRRLSDDSGGKTSSTGAAGYGRMANYVYMPVGFDLTHQLDSAWQIGGTGEFDIFLWGRQDSYLSDVDSNLPDLHNRQRHGMGLRASLEIVRTGDKYNFLLQPFVRYWHLKDSDTNVAIGPSGEVIGGLEPNNNSTELGVKAGVQF